MYTKDNVISIIESLENLAVLIDGISKKLKLYKSKTRSWISWYVVRRFRSFNLTKYVACKRCK